MGFSVSAATAILFTGIVVLAGVMSSVVFNIYGDLKDAALATSDSEMARQRTRVEVLPRDATDEVDDLLLDAR